MICLCRKGCGILIHFDSLYYNMSPSVLCEECGHRTLFDEDIPADKRVTGSVWCDTCNARIRWVSEQGSQFAFSNSKHVRL